jgi:hypothetical protein
MAQIRDVALSFNQRAQPTGSKHKALNSPLHTRNKRAGPSSDRRQGGSPKRLRAGSIGEDVIVIEDSNAASPSKSLHQHHNDKVIAEKEAKVGKGREERTLDPRMLKLFRVDQKKLA